MRGRKGSWTVISLDGYWYKQGKWIRVCEEGASNAASPRTKKGAFRIANRCPGMVEILFRPFGRARTNAAGITQSIVYYGEATWEPTTTR